MSFIIASEFYQTGRGVERGGFVEKSLREVNSGSRLSCGRKGRPRSSVLGYAQ
jgi:hypothetical protein